MNLNENRLLAATENNIREKFSNLVFCRIQLTFLSIIVTIEYFFSRNINFCFLDFLLYHFIFFLSNNFGFLPKFFKKIFFLKIVFFLNIFIIFIFRMVDCGSLFQGICTLRSLRNISIVEAHIKEPVVANNATASTVAFIAPGPPNPPITQVCLLFTRGILKFYRP